MPSRGRLFALLAALCALAAAAAIASAVRNGRASGTPAASPSARSAFLAARAEHASLLVFRSLSRDRPKTYGQIAFAALGRAGGARTLLALRCERVYFAGGRGLCLARGGGFAAGYRAEILGADLRVREALALAGVPSRARVSPDGRYGATTFFVSGHSYADTGRFSTQATLIDLRRGTKIGDLERFAVTRAGRLVTARDRNYWGVTFARDSDRFYATLATGGRTYLVQGSVRGRTAHTLHENVECPSLSPDGTRIAYKKRVGSGAMIWRLYVLDLATMRETRLAEARPIDDQVEWLDDDRILYKVDEEIWSVRADGRGRPRRFATQSDSPAVVR